MLTSKVFAQNSGFGFRGPVVCQLMMKSYSIWWHKPLDMHENRQLINGSLLQSCLHSDWKQRTKKLVSASKWKYAYIYNIQNTLVSMLKVSNSYCRHKMRGVQTFFGERQFPCLNWTKFFWGKKYKIINYISNQRQFHQLIYFRFYFILGDW